MLRHIALSSIVIATLFMSLQSVNADMSCGSMKWKGTDHNDNNPTMSNFWKYADKGLCTLSKSIDLMQSEGNKAVNFDKFVHTVAYTSASDEQQKCLDKAHQEGHGKDGLVGYEVLYCGTDDD